MPGARIELDEETVPLELSDMGTHFLDLPASGVMQGPGGSAAALKRFCARFEALLLCGGRFDIYFRSVLT